MHDTMTKSATPVSRPVRPTGRSQGRPARTARTVRASSGMRPPRSAYAACPAILPQAIPSQPRPASPGLCTASATNPAANPLRAAVRTAVLLVGILMLALGVGAQPAWAGKDFQKAAISASAGGGDLISYASPMQTLYLTEAAMDSLIEMDEDMMEAYLMGGDGDPVVQWMRIPNGSTEAVPVEGSVTTSGGQKVYSYSMTDYGGSVDNGAQIYAKVTLGYYSISSAKVQMISRYSSNAPTLEAGESITVPMSSTFRYSHFWRFSVPEGQTVTTFTCSGSSAVEGSLYDGTGVTMRGFDFGKELTLAPGDYFVSVYTEGPSYTLSFQQRQLNWGNVSVTGLDNVSANQPSIPFSVKLSGADPSVSLSSWSFSQDSHNNNGSLSGGADEAVLTTANVLPGYCTLRIAVEDDSFGWQHFEFPVVVKPLAVSGFSKGDVKTTYNSATIAVSASAALNGPQVLLQQSTGGAWQTVKTLDANTTETTVKGLKPNTSYQFRLVSSVPAADGDPAVQGAPTKSISVKTGYKTKPKVKSMKVSNVKVKYVKKKWVSGYWDTTGHWHGGYYAGGYYTTSYKLKITLKEKVKGSKGLIVNGKKVSGKGKTFTVNMKVTGKKKGKKISHSITSYRDKTYLGTTQYVKKKVKIK